MRTIGVIVLFACMAATASCGWLEPSPPIFPVNSIVWIPDQPLDLPLDTVIWMYITMPSERDEFGRSPLLQFYQDQFGQPVPGYPRAQGYEVLRLKAGVECVISLRLPGGQKVPIGHGMFVNQEQLPATAGNETRFKFNADGTISPG